MTEPDIAAFARGSIARGSKSFAAASRLLDARTRESVTLLYAWCRHCDDLVDGQEAGHATIEDPRPVAERIEALRRDTERAYAGDVRGLHPAFAALAEVARRHAIPRALAEEHIAGFAMDAEGRRYRTPDELMVYCWRVAGVVGVMIARIMGVENETVLDRAADLGLAFQLTNIARDVVEDARADRVYAPLDWLDREGIAPGDLTDPAHAGAIARIRQSLVTGAEDYYRSARIGIHALPLHSAWAVGTAWGVYRMIGMKLISRGEAAFDERIVTSGGEKFARVLEGAIMALWRTPIRDPRSPGLWTRRR